MHRPACLLVGDPLLAPLVQTLHARTLTALSYRRLLVVHLDEQRVNLRLVELLEAFLDDGVFVVFQLHRVPERRRRVSRW